MYIQDASLLAMEFVYEGIMIVDSNSVNQGQTLRHEPHTVRIKIAGTLDSSFFYALVANFPLRISLIMFYILC